MARGPAGVLRQMTRISLRVASCTRPACCLPGSRSAWWKRQSGRRAYRLAYHRPWPEGRCQLDDGPASVPVPIAKEDLVGRDTELAQIRSFLARPGTCAGALLIVGEQGVGKTILLDAAADAASQAGSLV